MKRTGLMRVKRASLLAVLTVVGNLSFSPADLTAAEKAKETPLTIRLDFIVGGNHAPWFVAWEKGFYAKRGLNVTIQPGTGSADTIRTIAAGGADVGFANVSTAIVGRSTRDAHRFGCSARLHSRHGSLARGDRHQDSQGPRGEVVGDQPWTGAMVSAAGSCKDQQHGLHSRLKFRKPRRLFSRWLCLPRRLTSSQCSVPRTMKWRRWLRLNKAFD